MPIYELKCQDCGADVSLFCSWKEKEKAKCPQCGSTKLAQKFTSIGILGGGSRAVSGTTDTSGANRSKFT